MFYKNTITKFNADFRINKTCKFSTSNGYFSLTDCPIFFKTNSVEAIDKIDKLCKFHENPIKNVDFIGETRQGGHDGPGVAHLSLLHCESKIWSSDLVFGRL